MCWRATASRKSFVLLALRARRWIDRSTNLIDWIPLTNVVLIDGPVDVTDTMASQNEQSFYRVRQ